MSSMKHPVIPVHQPGEAFVTEKYPACLAGLYLLSGEGELLRFDTGGIPIVEPDISAGLGFRLQRILKQYRSGSINGLSLGLVTSTGSDQKRGLGTMTFSDWLLKELFDAGRSADTPLTLLEEKNKTKTVFEAMELLLNKRSKTSPRQPQFCPVLFRPEVDPAILCKRYGIEYLDNRCFLEVLDLFGSFGANDCLPDELLDMVQNMREFQVNAASRTRHEPLWNKERWEDDFRGAAISLPDTGPADEIIESTTSLTVRRTDTCFNDGDVVTGWLLEWFSPFNELTGTQRDIIAGYETIHKIPSGTCLFEDGVDDGTCIYLVEGTLALTAADGETIWVQGGTRRSRLPISALTPHAYNVTAVSDISVVVFNYTLIEKISEITRTYTGIDRSSFSESSTEAISNRVQAMYLSHVEQ